jgi:hypothetical protein
VESCEDMDGSVKMSDELDAANGKDVAELRQGHAKPLFTFRGLSPVQGSGSQQLVLGTPRALGRK